MSIPAEPLLPRAIRWLRGNRINGLRLPSELFALMAAGRWKRPDDLSGVRELFPGELFAQGSTFTLYSLRMMESETRSLRKVREKDRAIYIGEPDPADPPGDIDSRYAVVIGDMGLGSDQPIALDYRGSGNNPRVLTLRWKTGHRPFGQQNRWVEVAPDFPSFVKRSRL
jgi:hypothetical protein